MCLTEKLPGAFLHPHDGVGFHPMGRWRYIGCLYKGKKILNPLPLPSALQITLKCDGLHVFLNMIRVVNNQFLFYFILFYW